MNKKIYKGYELIKAIEDEEITENQKVYLICMDKIPLFWRYGFLHIPKSDRREERKLDMFDLMSYDFEVEILEDNTEEIEELPTKLVYGSAINGNPEYHVTQKEIVDKINELVKAVNAIRKDKNND